MFSRLTAPIAAFVVLVVLALPNVGAAQMVPPPPSEEKDAGTADATPHAPTEGLE